MFDFLRSRTERARPGVPRRESDPDPSAVEVFKRSGVGPLGARGAGARLFDPGSLRLFMLAQIAASPSFGYDIIKMLRARLHGAYEPSPGSIYPNLRLLEGAGLVAAELVGKRARFVVTEAGRECVERNRAQIDEIAARLDEAAAPLAREQIGAALRGLNESVSRKFRKGDIDDARAETVNRILARARADIENA